MRYRSIERLPYTQIVSGCRSGSALSYVHLGTIKLLYMLAILWLFCNMALNWMLTFLAVGQLTEDDWGALKDQDRLSYSCSEGTVVVLQA